MRTDSRHKKGGYFTLFFLVFSCFLFFLSSAICADLMESGPAPWVDGQIAEEFIPVYTDFADEDAFVPPHPPIDEIPPMPMCEPPDPDGMNILNMIGSVLFHDAETGDTLELPEGIPGLSGQNSDSGYHGADGGQGASEDPLGIESFADMIEITNPEQFPWRMNCKLVMRFVDTAGSDRWFVCSGSMIDAETVLTAAHCVYARTADGPDIFDWAREIYVYPGWDGGHSQWTWPPSTVYNYGYGRGTQFLAGTAYITNGDTDRDCGLIRLTRAVGMLTGWYGWTWGYDCGWIQSRTYHNASFPSQNCPDPGLHTGTEMYYWFGSIDSCPGNQMQLTTGGGDCFNTVWGGMSGSPMYWIDGSTRRSHAVCSTSDRNVVGRYCKLWEQFTIDMNNDFIPGSRGTTFDLQALDVNAGPASIPVGQSTTLLNFLATNPTNATGSGTYTFRVYLSSNDNISSSDTLLSTQSFSWTFGTMSSVRVNMAQVMIPVSTPPGSYWIGVILDSATDSDSGNNDTDGWDAAPITVLSCPGQGAPTGVTASDGTSINYVYIYWNAAAGATSYEVWRNTSSSTDTATRIATGVTNTYYYDYSASPSVTYYYWIKATNNCGNTSGFSAYNTGWKAPTGTCLTPPDYNYTLTPKKDWQITSSNFLTQGCKIYRMYLYAARGYDFSICAGDGVGGSCTSDGDGDFTMYNSAGSQLWYIDGASACGYDASTLGTSYENWSPPADGYYYLKISEYGNNQPVTDYDLAYIMNGEYCNTPPSYDILIEPIGIWQVTDETFFAPSGCRIYRMYLTVDTGYDFSTCINDDVGGYVSDGETDFRMYDSAGSQLWYIDGSWSCGFDASTLNTSFEMWSPPADGYYYLKVSGYYDSTATYSLAYKACRLTYTPGDPLPPDNTIGYRSTELLQWKRGTYGVLENGTDQDNYAIAFIRALSGLTANPISWAELAVSSPEDLLAKYDVIYFSVNANATDYTNLISAVAAGGVLDEYAQMGGTLVLNVAGNQGSLNDIAPGGLDYNRTSTHTAETFVNAAHPYCSGVGYFGGTPLAESMFDNWSSTDHGWLFNPPAQTTSILLNTHGVSMLEYPWERGKVIVSTLTFNWANSSMRSGEPFENELYYVIDSALAWEGPIPVTILDDFNRADSTNMGADWTEVTGDFSIAGNMATSTTNNAVMTYNDDVGSHICVDTIYSGSGSVQYVGIFTGYADPSNNIFVKVQDNTSSGNFNTVFFRYGGNSGSSLGFDYLSPTFTSARMTVHLVDSTVTVEFDTNFDGMVDQSYSRSGFSTVSLGIYSGLGGYGNPLMDNFGIAPAVLPSSPSSLSITKEITETDREPEDASLLESSGPGDPLRADQIEQSLQNAASGNPGHPKTTVDILTPTSSESSSGSIGIDILEDPEAANLFSNSTGSQYLGSGVLPIKLDDAVLFDFPSVDSTVVASIGILDDDEFGWFWSADRGDSVQETFSTSMLTIDQAIFDFMVPRNAVGFSYVAEWDILINGTLIGHFVLADQETGPQHFEFNFPKIVGPDYTVRFEMTNTVPPGGGSHSLGYAGANAGTVQLIQTKECENVDLGHPTKTPSTGTGIGAERSVAVDINETVTVTELGIQVQMAAATNLTVTIRSVSGTTRGDTLKTATIPVPAGGLVFIDVPIVYTFQKGHRYDIGFNAGTWTGCSMEWYSHSNSSLDPAGGYDVGPFKVLDGGEWSGSGYGNTLLPHIRACIVPLCHILYDVYLDTHNPPSEIIGGGVSVPVYNLQPHIGEELESCTRYYWQVASRNCCNASAGPVWTFKTEMFGDLDKNGLLNLGDLALFAIGWMEPLCSDPDWCLGADMNYSGSVDMDDIKIISKYWLTICYEPLTRDSIVDMEDQMSGVSIPGSDPNDFWPETSFIYKTNQGRYGKFIVENLDKSSNNKLTIGWTTYNSNGTVYSAGTGLEIRGTWSCDLDLGVETSTDRDFFWSQQTSTERYLIPQNGAVFWMVYRANEP